MDAIDGLSVAIDNLIAERDRLRAVNAQLLAALVSIVRKIGRAHV